MDRGDSAMTARAVPAELRAACTDVTRAGPADVVAGRPASYRAAPASTLEAAGLLKAAAGLGLTVVPRGAGTKLDWGAPPSGCDLIVDTRRLDQVVEHAAGDLVVTAQSGVRLAGLAKVLSVAGQRLALDRTGDEESGTVGGLIATGAAGPLRYRYGAPRDLLIGLTVVRADGAITKSGGKVVKNVAGYDLGKLFAGSLGTLGLITEDTFRLHPAPHTRPGPPANTPTRKPLRPPSGSLPTLPSLRPRSSCSGSPPPARSRSPPSSRATSTVFLRARLALRNFWGAG